MYLFFGICNTNVVVDITREYFFGKVLVKYIRANRLLATLTLNGLLVF